MIIKNSDIQSLVNFLVNEKLSGKTSRMRTRFVNLLNERLKEIEEFRLEIVEKYAEKDDEGKPITNDNKYKIVDMEAFNKDYDELMNEEFIIDETHSKKDMLLSVKRILESTEMEFSGQEAFLYDKWCEAFENLKYEEEASPKE